MSDTMRAQPFEILLSWILQELEANDSIFGIHRSLFYVPKHDSPYATPDCYGQHLSTPIGPAAGPHTQLAQNIVCAWLTGGRFIELKTVQIMDDLQIPRPCIDMADEGYNVEWSQELSLEQSAQEYVNAWALIHILHRLLGWEGNIPLGTVFNMSVGYNLEGIQSAPMVRFMDRLQDASADLAELRSWLQARFPQFADVAIPAQVTNNVTLSTMHGCPPDEIERIARYLLEERGLHTTIKLNPTLLGQEAVLHILHDRLGYREIQIPDRVFAHDLQYSRAVELIRNLKVVAAARGLAFGVKLSNTLAMANHRGVLPGDEMYMSGRALYPVTMGLFHKLVREFGGDLNVSYSAGADALNVTTILACGARPVTVASDLLKPGGYARLRQYLENLESSMLEHGVSSLEALAQGKLANLERAAAEALENPRYKKVCLPCGLPKVDSRLDLFDCIAAPCIEQCAVCQDVPEYARLIARGEHDQALAVILRRNPLPGVTGYICTHLCQTRCTRSNYDEPVAIRDLKRFACEHGRSALPPVQATGRRVAVVGGGPSGLSAAYFLALSGVGVTIFEAQDKPGGMPAIAPPFRLPPEVLQADVDRIRALGVVIRLQHPVIVPPEVLLREGFAAVYVACGFPQDAALSIEGADGQGVFSALRFLQAVARGEKPPLGPRVLVIGGGNTAMDAARTAQRLTGRPVTVVYRRTRAEMPAAEEELRDLLDEGNRLIELASPSRVVLRDGRVAAMECVRNALGEPDASGRRRPVPVAGSEFQVEADSIIVAIGQAPNIAFLEGSAVKVGTNGAIAADPATGRAMPSVYAGGDAVRGPATVVEACADGRRAAEAICRDLGIAFTPPPPWTARPTEGEIIAIKRARARRELRHEAPRLPLARRAGFEPVEGTLEEHAARAEAGRCLQCADLCDKCVEVCPNRANYSYRVSPVSLTLPVLACRDPGLAIVGSEAFAVRQVQQIVHLAELCNECGNCATFCVHRGKPYTEKPSLFLQRDAYERHDGNAFYREGSTLCRREGGREARLAIDGGVLTCEDAHVRLRLGPDFAVEEMALKEAFPGTRSLVGVAEMAVILEGLRASLPFLDGAQPAHPVHASSPERA